MYKVIRTCIRPSLEVEFFTPSDETLTALLEKYDNTGRRVSRDVDVSDDGLTLTITNIFKSEEDYNEMVAEFASHFADFDSYCKTYNITVEYQYITE